MSICVFGDSIAWGAYDPIGGGWVTLLRNHVEANRERLGNLSVYNLGICGDTTTGLLARFDQEIKIREPGMVIFAIGINDSSGIKGRTTPHISPTQFEHNLTSMLHKAHKYTKKILFIGLTPIDETKTAPDPWGSGESYLSKNVREYDDLLHNFCTKNNLEYLSTSRSITLDTLPDGLHPNTEGHQKIFQAVKPLVEKMLSST